jgi:hypothetical protein
MVDEAGVVAVVEIDCVGTVPTDGMDGIVAVDCGESVGATMPV